MVSYHINELTGRINICRASNNRCPLKNVDGETVPHFNSKSEATVFNESRMSDLHKPLVPARKAVKTSFKSLPEHENEILTARMIREHESMIENLSREEYKSLSYYSFSGAYPINKILRNNDENSESIADDVSRELDISHIHNLDRIFQKFGNSDGTEKIEKRTVYRYLKLDKKIDVEQYISKNFTKDSSYVEEAYMSTTEDLSYIAGYAHKRRDKNFVILTLETNKGISLQKDEEQIGNIQSFEKERLLPRGMKFKVDEASTVKIGIDDSRDKLLKQFNGAGSIDSQEKSVNNIPERNFKIISLTENNAI